MEQNLLKKISKHLNQNELSKALFFLKQLKKTHSKDVKYWELLALTYGMSGKNADAINASKQALKLNPDNIGTYINLAVAQQNIGLLDDAEETLNNAIIMDSTHPQVQNNLGAIYILKSEHSKAKPYIEKAIVINPDYSDAFSNLGEIYKNNLEYDNAIESYKKSIQLNSNNINAYVGLGMLYTHLERYDEGEYYLKYALKLNPSSAEILFSLGSLHYYKKSLNVATKYFNETIQIDPNHKKARYLLSAITGQETPDQSPETYVKSLFDHYAERFDEHLVNDLGYSVPETMYKLYTENAKPENTHNLLDLGCGTGLSGAQFRAMYDHLTGIDLAEKMIKKSKNKNIYNELYNTDISIFLEECSTRYDLVIAADVFIYIGNLDEIVKKIYDKQNKGGYFIFSIEQSSKHDSFNLRNTGRYSHSIKYIKTILDNSFYDFITSVPTILRNEDGQGIDGIIYLCQKSPV